MTMMEIRPSDAIDAEMVFRLPDVGPGFARIGNPAYVQLINEFTQQYLAHNPDESRPYIRVAGEIDHVISEVLRAGINEVPIAAGRLALGPSV